MTPFPRGKRMTIDLVVNSTLSGNKRQFDDIPELRSDTDKDALVFGIQAFSVDMVPLTFNGNTVSSFAQLQNASLTLYVVGVEQQFNIPMIRLLNMQTALATNTAWISREPFYFSPLRIDWTKSYVSANSGAIAGASNYSFYFEMTYEWMPSGAYGNYMKHQLDQWANGIIKL